MTASILDHFKDLEDPRIFTDNQRHQLLDIVVISMLSVLCGAEGWADISAWAEEQQEWLATFLALPNGIPSRDCIRRVVSRLDADEFHGCFSSWMAAVCEVTEPVFRVTGLTQKNFSGTRCSHESHRYPFADARACG